MRRKCVTVNTGRLMGLHIIYRMARELHILFLFCFVFTKGNFHTDVVMVFYCGVRVQYTLLYRQ